MNTTNNNDMIHRLEHEGKQILLIGTAISGNFNLDEAFWKKMDRLATRESRMIDGRVRVSEFKDT